MNKFIKISLITAGILAGVGVVFCLIGGIVSGRNFIASVKNDAYMERRFEAFWKAVEGVEEGFEAAKTGSVIHHASDRHSGNSGKLTVNNSDVGDGSSDYRIETEGIRELKLSLGAGTCIISEKDEADGVIDLYVSGTGGVDYFIKENALHVEGFKGNYTIGFQEPENNNITLRIPKDMGFDEIDLEIGAGAAEVFNLKAREMEALVGAGELIIDKAEIVEFEAEIGAGHLMAGGMHVWNADVDVDLGECSFEGIIEQELDAECAMGSMEFQLKGKEENYNYEIECSAGNIRLNGVEFSALGMEKYVNNGAANTFELSCDMGNITLNFVEGQG